MEKQKLKELFESMSLKEKAKAILEVWMPGTMGGPAIVDILTGNCAPSGKLPMSFPYCIGQVPVHYDELPTGRRHSPGKDKDRYVSKYLDIPSSPLYPFGYGLTYTKFSILEPCVSKNTMKSGETVEVSAIIKNCGNRSGVETVQMYIHDVTASVSRPVKQLKGFKKVFLLPGEEKAVKFEIKEDMLCFTRGNNTRGSEAGKFEVFIGDNSATEKKVVFELI